MTRTYRDQELARLGETICEGLPAAEAGTWPRRFASAIPIGADLSMVTPRFLLDLLTAPDGAVQRAQARPPVAGALAAVVGLLRSWTERGLPRHPTEWREARDRADAAACDAADAAAYAARAADANADDAAGYVARAAAAAAYVGATHADAAAYYDDAPDDAGDSARASSARAREVSRQSTVLLRLLADAEVHGKAD